ncbi:MAG: hypothetical protein JXB00_16510 [Bacteroidales bacterium]|nr:hypothetical protein [Bacteroidales bacterium]
MKTQYIPNSKGEKISVVLPIRDFEKMMEDLEELEEIKAYDRAKSRKSNPVPFDQAVKEMELLRKDNV